MLSKLLIRLESNVLDELESLATESRTTKTQLIRDAIQSFLVKRKEESIEKINNELLKYAGILKGTEMDVDGLDYQHKIREEWERDL